MVADSEAVVQYGELLVASDASVRALCPPLHGARHHQTLPILIPEAACHVKGAVERDLQTMLASDMRKLGCCWRVHRPIGVQTAQCYTLCPQLGCSCYISLHHCQFLLAVHKVPTSRAYQNYKAR